ncbi:MAG: 2Fe-2S iron-sulfur cluster-binding protein [Pseudomonadota bacterium]
MSQQLAISRAAKLIGISRATLQKRIKEGGLHSFDGTISTEELLQLYPDLKLEDSGLFEQTRRIKEEAFRRRIMDRTLPAKEVLAERLFEQGMELNDLKLHLQRYHTLVIDLQARIRELAGSSPDAKAALEQLDQWLEQELQHVLGQEQKPDSLEVMDAMLKVMSAHVTLRPSGRDFFVEGNDTLLEAALKAGLALNYGCSSGNCGLCKARVISGQVMQTRHYDYVLSDPEKQQGYTLMCCHTAVSDVVLEALEAHSASDIPKQQLTARVKAVTQLSDDMMLLHLQTPRSHRLRFLAGQSATLGHTTAGSAELPIASCPCNDRDLQFHVERGLGGAFGERVWGGMKAGENITVYGPWGDYILREDSQNDAIFVAFDRGFAPIKSLLEHSMARESNEEMGLVWAASKPDGHYMNNLCRAWADALENFHYLPVSMANRDSAEAAVAVVLEKLLAEFPKARKADVYLAGPEAYIAPAVIQLLAAGFPKSQVTAMAV